MNNNGLKFDPMTGKPLNNNVLNFDPMTGQPLNNNQNVQAPLTTLQDIPTVDQSKENFINKIEASNDDSNKNKGESVNYTFIIILFILFLLIVCFGFPYLIKYI